VIAMEREREIAIEILDEFEELFNRKGRGYLSSIRTMLFIIILKHYCPK